MSAPLKRHASNDAESNTTKLSTTQSKDKLLNIFIGWLSENGFNVNPKVIVTKEGSCAQYGLVAVEDIDEQEVLFQILRPLLLSPETTVIADVLEKEEDHIQSESGWVSTILALLYEYNNPSSKWRPYLDLVLDFKELDLPMLWARSEREDLLQGTGTNETVEKDLQNIEKEFEMVVLPFIKRHPDLFSKSCEDIELYKRMVAFVMAYSFTEPWSSAQDEEEDEENSGSSQPMIVPLADILNHVAKNNAHLTFENEVLKMVAIRNIRKGEEVFNTYGELSNQHLLHMYGFAEPYPNNHYDTVEIPIKLLVHAAQDVIGYSEDAFSRKKKVLHEMGLYADGVTMVVGIDGILSEEETYQTLKILTMSKEDLDVLEENDGWLEEEDESKEESLNFQHIKLLPDQWKEILSRCAKVTLQQYKDSIEEDSKSLSDCTKLTSRQKYSLYTKYGQKQILHKLTSACLK
ncbi:hypothetical protein CHS0354_024658 [Potamilus streckersoni]|uniref:N-lysine methyltransferase n=1 Tax=Potamilus streckersoni TaxID=2493646 RepID=A0AAE0W3D0_9BIVA|nr:hypothetical protein CHS0354_024658 [Potamilus streckersoni]